MYKTAKDRLELFIIAVIVASMLFGPIIVRAWVWDWRWECAVTECVRIVP